MNEENPVTLPTIGRIVHYVSYGSADGTYPSMCRAAVVTEVVGEKVSLCVLNPTGLFLNQGMGYAEPEEAKGGTWHWPLACGQQS